MKKGKAQKPGTRRGKKGSTPRTAARKPARPPARTKARMPARPAAGTKTRRPARPPARTAAPSPAEARTPLQSASTGRELEDLQFRLQESEETLSAIRRGEVDGLVISGPDGDRVFTLKGADRSYRLFVEAMNEGAITLSLDGTILYCNERFCQMTGFSDREVMGNNIQAFLAVSLDLSRRRMETLLRRKDGEPAPVSISINPMERDEAPGICMVVTDLSERMRKESILRESEERLRDLSARLLTAQEEERKRISHEIHDALGSLLSGVRFMAENLLRQIGGSEDLEDMIRYIQQACDETRRIQTALHPPLLDDLGIIATLNWLSREFQKTYGTIKIQSSIDITEEAIPPSIKIVIYRVVQEALNNVAKHSSASIVTLTLRMNGGVQFSVKDNGRGIPTADGSRARRGIGLSSMKERTELSGGTFSVESSPGEGTTITALWPEVPQTRGSGA